MNENIFWSIVDATIKTKNLQSKTTKLIRALKKLSKGDRAEFYKIYNTLFVSSYTPEMVSILDIIQHGSHSDDSFSDFRHWLIFLGSHQYKIILHDPDSITSCEFSFLEKLTEYIEEFSYILSNVIEELNDEDVYIYPDIDSNYDWLDSLENSLQDQDYIKLHFPKLYNVYYVDHPKKRRKKSEIDPDNILPDWLTGHLDP